MHYVESCSGHEPAESELLDVILFTLATALAILATFAPLYQDSARADDAGDDETRAEHRYALGEWKELR